MNKKIRLMAFVLANIGIILSVLYLGFFLICSAKASRTARMLDDPDTADAVTPEDMHLEKAVHGTDFSVLSVGKALSDKDDPGRDSALLIVDLIIPVLCLTSGILLQLASVRKKNKPATHAMHTGSDKIQSFRRQS